MPYKELATNPLMLSMLLCVFGDKDTAGKRTYAVQELYQKALEIMLTRVLWGVHKLDSAIVSEDEEWVRF